MGGTARLVDELWGLTGGEAASPNGLEVFGAEHVLASRFAVTEAAATSVAAATTAAADLFVARGGEQQHVTVDREHAAAAFSAERLLRVNGEPVAAWASLSGAYRTRDDRYIQLHCNFPHHAAGIGKRLGVPEDRAAFEAAILQWDAVELETALIEAGMVAAAYRTLEEWDAHPHAQATAGLPVLELARLGDGDATLPEAPRPLEGVRVLDCSRVLAGPVAGMTLASHGADVLRIGADHLPWTASGVQATGFGKRNTNIDLRTPEGKATFTRLLERADVMIDAFRPGSLAALGFGPDEVARIRPGIVMVQLCAFDWIGPWGGRRGFDSIIQSTTGIALAAAGDDGRPVHLPVQALDHATGFLAAFAAIRGLTRRQREGGSWLARLALLRTRNWLVGLGEGGEPDEPIDLTRYLHEVDSAFGPMSAVRPVGGLAATPPHWDRAPSEIGSAPPAWL